MKPFRPSNKVPPFGLLLMSLSAVFGGLLIGGVTYLVSQLIYLVVIFPIVIGAISGVLIGRAVRRGKVRNPWVVGAFSLLIGLLSYGAYHYIDYRVERQQAHAEVLREIQQQLGRTDPVLADQVIDQNIQEITGLSGFAGYMALKAQAGLSFAHFANGLPILQFTTNPFFTAVYWLIELLIIVAVALQLSRALPSQPFCEIHQRWYDQHEHLGGVPDSRSTDLINQLHAGHFAEAGAMLEGQNTFWPSVELYLKSCQGCTESEARLQIARLTSSRGRVQARSLLQGMLSSFQQADLKRGIQNRISNASLPQPHGDLLFQ